MAPRHFVMTTTLIPWILLLWLLTFSIWKIWNLRSRLTDSLLREGRTRERLTRSQEWRSRCQDETHEAREQLRHVTSLSVTQQEQLESLRASLESIATHAGNAELDTRGVLVEFDVEWCKQIAQSALEK